MRSYRNEVEGVRRRAFATGMAIAGVLGAAALALADVPHAFQTGDTLQAEDLNGNFRALDQRIAALEKSSPLLGTYPAVLGRGEHIANNAPVLSGDRWFCGGPESRLDLSVAPLRPNVDQVTFSSAFGTILFTNAGVLTLNLDAPNPACPVPSFNLCSEPVTFFLISPRAQEVTVNNYLDDGGAIYLDEKPVLTGLSSNPNRSTISVPQGPFALSFVACSNNGPTIAFVVYDTFLTNPSYGLTIDFDRVFHRNGR